MRREFLFMKPYSGRAVNAAAAWSGQRRMREPIRAPGHMKEEGLQAAKEGGMNAGERDNWVQGNNISNSAHHAGSGMEGKALRDVSTQQARIRSGEREAALAPSLGGR